MIDWKRVCMLVNASPAVCRVEDEYGWYPLHFACFANAPLYLIQLFVRTWGDALLNDTVYDDKNEWSALLLACNADAPLEVIEYLVKNSHRGGSLNDEAQCIVIKRKRELDVLRCVADQWPERESIYTQDLLWSFEKNKDRERALYRFENNDPDLKAIQIGWPLPSESVLREVVNLITSHSTIERVEFIQGESIESEYNVLPWCIGKERATVELMKSTLGANTSITDIHGKFVNAFLEDHILEIVQDS